MKRNHIPMTTAEVIHYRARLMYPSIFTRIKNHWRNFPLYSLASTLNRLRDKRADDQADLSWP